MLDEFIEHSVSGRVPGGRGGEQSARRLFPGLNCSSKFRTGSAARSCKDSLAYCEFRGDCFKAASIATRAEVPTGDDWKMPELCYADDPATVRLPVHYESCADSAAYVNECEALNPLRPPGSCLGQRHCPHVVINDDWKTKFRLERIGDVHLGPSQIQRDEVRPLCSIDRTWGPDADSEKVTRLALA
jgi:hypothetical protein